ncbi:MAG: hypothetical protein QNJ47_15325 [Nostocaceae cyanobacterium]|nr:hypothetical protein [Nostocaceae cyanobacterium]
MQAKEIKERLKSLIQEASAVDPNLMSRLEEINRWIKNVKPGSLTAKKLLILFLVQIIDDAEVWLKFKSLPSKTEQQAAINALNPALRYWYSYLFPKWLSENDPKFYIWRQKLMTGDFIQEDENLLLSITNNIKKRGGNVVRRYIADLSMTTDIIVSNRNEKPLCVQITSLSDEYSQIKSEEWKNVLCFWEIERGLFLSFNPSTTNFVNQIVNITLYNSDNLKTGMYLKFSL